MLGYRIYGLRSGGCCLNLVLGSVPHGDVAVLWFMLRVVAVDGPVARDARDELTTSSVGRVLGLPHVVL
jgi:hypothetical protein